jgi:hypothetical protein
MQPDEKGQNFDTLGLISDCLNIIKAFEKRTRYRKKGILQDVEMAEICGLYIIYYFGQYEIRIYWTTLSFWGFASDRLIPMKKEDQRGLAVGKDDRPEGSIAGEGAMHES